MAAERRERAVEDLVHDRIREAFDDRTLAGLHVAERGEAPLQLALRPSAQVVEITATALPAGLRDVEVATASAADFDDLLLAGGAR